MPSKASVCLECLCNDRVRDVPGPLPAMPESGTAGSALQDALPILSNRAAFRSRRRRETRVARPEAAARHLLL